MAEAPTLSIYEVTISFIHRCNCLQSHNCINKHIFSPELSQTQSGTRISVSQVGPKRSNAFTKELKLSDDLAAFVGKETMSRPQVPMNKGRDSIACEVLLGLFQGACAHSPASLGIEPARPQQQALDRLRRTAEETAWGRTIPVLLADEVPEEAHCGSVTKLRFVCCSASEMGIEIEPRGCTSSYWGRGRAQIKGCFFPCPFCALFLTVNHR